MLDRVTMTDFPCLVHISKPVCKSSARAIPHVFFRGKQICKGGLHKIPLLPSRVRNGESVMLKVLITIEDDIEVQWPGSKALSSEISAQRRLQLCTHRFG